MDTMSVRGDRGKNPGAKMMDISLMRGGGGGWGKKGLEGGFQDGGNWEK